jgi:hypothetical protein
MRVELELALRSEEPDARSTKVQATLVLYQALREHMAAFHGNTQQGIALLRLLVPDVAEETPGARLRTSLTDSVSHFCRGHRQACACCLGQQRVQAIGAPRESSPSIGQRRGFSLYSRQDSAATRYESFASQVQRCLIGGLEMNLASVKGHKPSGSARGRAPEVPFDPHDTARYLDPCFQPNDYRVKDIQGLLASQAGMPSLAGLSKAQTNAVFVHVFGPRRTGQ